MQAAGFGGATVGWFGGSTGSAWRRRESQMLRVRTSSTLPGREANSQPEGGPSHSGLTPVAISPGPSQTPAVEPDTRGMKNGHVPRGPVPKCSSASRLTAHRPAFRTREGEIQCSLITLLPCLFSQQLTAPLLQPLQTIPPRLSPCDPCLSPLCVPSTPSLWYLPFPLFCTAPAQPSRGSRETKRKQLEFSLVAGNTHSVVILSHW